MAMIVGQTYEQKLVCKLDRQVSINVLHWNVSAIGGASLDVLTVAQNMDSIVAPLLKACVSAAATYVGSSLQMIDPPPPEMAAVVTTLAGAGGVAGDPLPLQTCGIITKLTGLAGRKFRGRMYVPFPGEGHNDTDGTPVPAYITVLNALSVYVRNTITTVAGASSVQLKAILKNNEFPAQIRPITGTISRDKWAVQHRRGDYGQANITPF